MYTPTNVDYMHMFIAVSSAPPPPPYTATIDPYSKMIQSAMKLLHTPSDIVIEVSNHFMQGYYLL